MRVFELSAAMHMYTAGAPHACPPRALLSASATSPGRGELNSSGGSLSYDLDCSPGSTVPPYAARTPASAPLTTGEFRSPRTLAAHR